MARRLPPNTLVVFGASGDLTSRKLLPALGQLARRQLLPDGFALVGVARTPLGDEGFRRLINEAVADAGREWDVVIATARYISGDYGDPETFSSLALVLDELDAKQDRPASRVFYMATV